MNQERMNQEHEKTQSEQQQMTEVTESGQSGLKELSNEDLEGVVGGKKEGNNGYWWRGEWMIDRIDRRL